MDRVVVVTGGSRGIGKEICLQFAKSKDKVVICYLNSEKEAIGVAKQVEKLGGTAYLHKVDVADNNSVIMLRDDVLKVFGRVDVLVNCAGVACYKLLIDMTEQEKRAIIDVNLMGTINMCQAFAKNMIANSGGKIINVSSMWGVYGGSGESVYSASKAGVIGFSKALAKELGLSNINVNVVAPGTIMTDMTANLSKETLLDLSMHTALGRLGKPSDVAGVVSFLASDEASYITGSVLGVDGLPL